MKKTLIIAGVSGHLGKGILKIMLKKNYDNYFIFVRKRSEFTFEDSRVTKIESGDFSKEEDVSSAFQEINPDKDTVFYLFSSIGGFTGGKPTWDYSLDELENMIKLNLYTGFLVSKYFALVVKQAKAGSICLTTAMTSIKPELNKSLYGLSKSALNSLVKTLAMEGRSINLSANAIAPYIIDTPANREWVKDTSILIKPVEMAEVVYSLFENYRYVSGNIVELKQNLSF